MRLGSNRSYCFVIFILVIVAMLGTSCALSNNKAPEVFFVVPELQYVYPLHTTEIECVASDPDGDNVTFSWSATGGTFEGSGPVVTWKSPNQYGDFHIMVVVNDDKGGSTQATTTVSVVVKKIGRGCCGG